MKLIIFFLILGLSFTTLADNNSEDLSKILKDAEMVPYLKNGKVEGFKIVTLKKGSKFERLGFKKGDVIKSVNGVPIDSPAKAMELYSKIKQEDKIQVEASKSK